jgi:uncharacterized protein YaeQ
MAIKPTIYKARVALSDTDRHVYDTLNLTIARHPSETEERMMVRLLAYCFNAQEHLLFCKGLSDADEADLWAYALNGTLDLWIDVGEPAPDRIRKASRLAGAVKVYSFNSKSPTWWAQNQAEFALLQAEIYRFDWDNIKLLSAMCTRNMDLSVTISGGTAFVAGPDGEVEITAEPVQSIS